MNNIAIVIPCFNRADSLNRLLLSINNAIYDDLPPTLIFSIDGGGSQDVIELVTNFKFKHGNKRIILHPKNKGLKENIIFCGGLTEQYEAIILLEDDLYVADLFYIYAVQSINYYKENELIAGISLYSQRFNETNGLPFLPNKDDSDVFFMQLPSSWGQIWTRKNWNDFYLWYLNNKELTKEQIDQLPENIKRWSKQSWKKLFCVFLVESKKYFVYPYISLSTNFCSPGGVHVEKQINHLQTPLLLSDNLHIKFKFVGLKDSVSVYDLYHENISIRMFKAISEIDESIFEEDVCIDLNGLKHKCYLEKFKYVLTTRKVSSSIVSYNINFKPIENNILFMNFSEESQKADVISLTTPNEIIYKKNIPYYMVEFFCGASLTDRRFSLNIFYMVFNKAISRFLNRIYRFFW